MNLITFRALLRHPLITGSSVIFIGSFVANIFNYLFNLSMGRLLSVEDYGLLTSLSSLFILLAILSVAFTNIFAKLSARYVINDEVGKLKYLISEGFKYLLIIAGAFLIVLILSTNIIGNFLHIENNILLILVFFSLFFSLLYSLAGGVLQGHLRFYTYSFLNIFQTLIKFILGIILVFLGFEVFGALLSILIASVVVFVTGFIVILIYLNKEKRKSEIIIDFRGKFSHYTYTFVLTSLGITLLSNTDIILVRHLFDPIVSGQYAALSLMGKAIFYFILPINFVFFPLIAQKKEKNERLFNTVLLTSGIVFAFSITVSFIYFVFPGLVLQVFFPSPEYQALRPYLGIFSLYILIFSLVNIFNSFFLSVGLTKVYLLTVAAAFLQILLIFLFHNSLYQIIGVLFFVNFLLLVSYLIYYMKHGKD